MTETIAINLVKSELPVRTNYRKTSPHRRDDNSKVLLSFSSHSPGKYSASGKGGDLSVGDTLFVSLKGSESLSIPLMIQRLSYLIEPSDQWQADLSGEAFESLDILSWQVACDVCHQTYPLEFVSRTNDDPNARLKHAESRLAVVGWQQSDAKHICPACVGIA